MATLYRGRGARNCLWIRPLSLDFSSLSFYLSRIFNSCHEFLIFMLVARVHATERDSIIEKFNDDMLDRNSSDQSF